jgi:hypothetical protein
MIHEYLPSDSGFGAVAYIALGLVLYVCQLETTSTQAKNFVQVAALSIYRVYFHPLAKYPGSLSYKLSSWPLLWQAYRGDRHIWHLLDHEKYGKSPTFLPRTMRN